MPSAISTPTYQALAGNIFNADGTTPIYSAGAWAFKNASATTTFSVDSTGAATFLASISLPSSGATPSALNFYAESYLDTVLTPNGVGSTASSTGRIQITRVGRVVTLTIPRINDARPLGTTSVLASSALPTWARPAIKLSYYILVFNNNAALVSEVDLETTGVINVYKDLSGSAFTNSQNAGIERTSISYSV